MSRTLVRAAALAAISLGPATGVALAQGVFIGPPPSVVSPQPLTGKRGRVARELQAFGYGGADVATMSNRTVALLDNVIHGGGSHSIRRGRIASILNGGGFLQRAVDSLSGR